MRLEVLACHLPVPVLRAVRYFTVLEASAYPCASGQNTKALRTQTQPMSVHLTANLILTFMFQYVIFVFQRNMIDLKVSWGSRTRHSDSRRVTNRLQ
jgi:hypothetical protein